MHRLNRSIGNPQQFSGHKHGAPAGKHMCSLHQNGWAAMGCQPSCVSPHSLFKLIGDRIERRTRAVAKRENWDTFRHFFAAFLLRWQGSLLVSTKMRFCRLVWPFALQITLPQLPTPVEVQRQRRGSIDLTPRRSCSNAIGRPGRSWALESMEPSS